MVEHHNKSNVFPEDKLGTLNGDVTQKENIRIGFDSEYNKLESGNK